jgi:hypothetical protein
MQVINLIIEHATGKRTRTVNHIIVDEFPECEALRVQIRKCFSTSATER